MTVGAEPLPTYPALAAGIAPRLDDEAEVYAALVLGLRDYVRKNGFQTVVIGLSGGIDSALTAAIACDAARAPTNVYGVSMPSGYSSEHSQSDAAELAERTGLHYLDRARSRRWSTRYLAAIELTGLAEENLQARVRGTIVDGAVQPATATSCWRPATRASSRSATPRSTATRSAASRRSRTCRRRWSGSCRGGATRTRRRAARRRRSPRRRSASRRRPSCGPVSSTPTRCRTTTLLDDVLDDYVEQDRGSERPRRRRVRPGAGRARPADDRHGGVQASAVPARPEDLAARPSAATVDCPSPTAGASTRRHRLPAEFVAP